VGEALTPKLLAVEVQRNDESNNSCRSAREGPASDKTSWLSHWISVLIPGELNRLSLCLTSQGELGRADSPTLLFG